MTKAKKYTYSKKSDYNGSWLMHEIAKRGNFTLGDVKLIFRLFIDIVGEVIKENKVLNISGLFRLSVTTIKAHKGWDGFKKEYIDLPDAYKVVMSPSQIFYNLLYGTDEYEDEEDNEFG